jgi:hypothetical protein
MPRPARYLPGVALALLVLSAGCSKQPSRPAPSNFFLKGGFDQQYDAAAKQVGVKLMDRFGSDPVDTVTGKSEWIGGESFCGRPEQADEFMRALQAEMVKRLRAENAEPSGELPTGPVEVAEWTIAYTTGPLEGTVKATRHEPRVGPCDGRGVFYYKVIFRVTETRKKSH